ncbi:MAG TPA: YaaA family protein [Anaerolineales bacterium]|nr:YaaA family protein [Anaerolineales bacterium]HRQ93094.1 YaaA family protein [Anaerolineales bacterium]
MLILLHSSKAMRTAPEGAGSLDTPQLLPQARLLAGYLKTLSPATLASMMKLSGPLAAKTHALIASWTDAPAQQTAALDSFIGDIYSGMQAPSLTQADRQYAHKTLRILSGLYGVLRPLDGIVPYRLEMGYKLPNFTHKDMYAFWGSQVAETLPSKGAVINLAAKEYFDVVTPYMDTSAFVAPKFLTLNRKTGQPAFVTVHAKVARGAFAHWLLVNRVNDVADLAGFNEIGYCYDKQRSTADTPVFVCKDFGGTGLSIRMQDKQGLS